MHRKAIGSREAGSVKSVRSILVAFLAFSAHGFAAVTVTSPANDATVTSPVRYVATATTTTCAKGVASMGIYVNDKLTYVVDGESLNTTLSLSPGKVQHDGRRMGPLQRGQRHPYHDHGRQR